MSFSILDVLTDGFRRTVAKNGLTLVLVTYALSVLYLLFLPLEMGSTAQTPESIVSSPIIGGSVWLGAAVTLVSLLLLGYVPIVAYRTFASDETEQIPRSAVRDRPFWAYLNVLVGGIVFGVLVLVGFMLFLIPGFFVLVALWFFGVAIAVENDDFIAAFKRSWGLTSGNRLRLFVLGFVVFVLLMAVSSAFAIPQSIVGGVPGVLIAQIGSAITAVYTYATSAVAYTQLAASRTPDDGVTARPADD